MRIKIHFPQILESWEFAIHSLAEGSPRHHTKKAIISDANACQS